MKKNLELDEVAMWTSLFVYFAVWIIVPWLILGGNLWYVGVIWSVVYVAAHVNENANRGHCYLSADSTAFPAVLVTAIVLVVVLARSDVTTVTADRAAFFTAYLKAFGFSFVLGHVLSLIYSAAVDILGRRIQGVLAHRRIARRK